jgi:RNA polymerase sigma factor (sigma-70 family)
MQPTPDEHPDKPLGRTDSLIQDALDRFHAGDLSAKNDLLIYAEKQLRRMTRQKFPPKNSLHRWEETEDVFQNLQIRLSRALDQMEKHELDSPRRFFKIAAKNIDWAITTLVDKNKRLRDHYRSDVEPAGTDGPAHGGRLRNHPAKNTADPVTAFAQLLEGIKALTETDQEILTLMFVNGCTYEEAADTVGLPLSTFKRRYRDARLKLHDTAAVGQDNT